MEHKQEDGIVMDLAEKSDNTTQKWTSNKHIAKPQLASVFLSNKLLI